jgi:hypothetical protein
MKPLLSRLVLLITAMLSGFGLAAQCCDFTYQQQVEPPTSAATFGVALGDFDQDGDRDAVSISAYYGIDVYFNNGSGIFTLHAQYATGSNGDYYGVKVADVDGDGDLDIIAMPFYTSAGLMILKNNGAGVFVPGAVSSNIAVHNGAVGDIDSDGDIDIFLPNSGGGSGKVFKNNGLGIFTLFQTISGARGHDVEFGDLDGDGDLDAFVVENSTYGNAVFLNDSLGNFTMLGIPFGANGSNVALGDLDKDGDLDAWVGKSNNSSEIWVNNGSGLFSLHSTITTGSYCKAVNLYDLDGDNDLDVFLGFYSSTPQVWKNMGDMTFVLCYQAPAGSSSHGQAIGFINNDNNIDIYSGYFSNNDGDYVFLNASPGIVYTGGPFCPDIAAPQNVLFTGTPGGVYSSVPIGLDLNTTTGEIVPAASMPGLYTVFYTLGSCAVTAPVRIKSLDTTTTVAVRTITAVQDSATYQWVDCNNGYQHIAGATSQSYTAPVAGGDFAVIIAYDGCTDTSACIHILNTSGISETDPPKGFEVYPNPADDILSIRIPAGFIGTPFLICDQVGRVLLTGILTDVVTDADISSLPRGIYYLKADGEILQVIKL